MCNFPLCELIAWLPSIYFYLPGSQPIPGRGVLTGLQLDLWLTPGTNTCGPDDEVMGHMCLQEELWIEDNS